MELWSERCDLSLNPRQWIFIISTVFKHFLMMEGNMSIDALPSGCLDVRWQNIWTCTNTHAWMHDLVLLSRSIWLFEIESRQARLFCWIAPRASILSEVLPNQLYHTHRPTHSQSCFSSCFATCLNAKWEATWVTLILLSDREVSSIPIQVEQCIIKMKIPVYDWRLVKEHLERSLTLSMHLWCWWLFVCLSCLIMKISPQIDFCSSSIFSVRDPF